MTSEQINHKNDHIGRSPDDGRLPSLSQTLMASWPGGVSPLSVTECENLRQFAQIVPRLKPDFAHRVDHGLGGPRPGVAGDPLERRLLRPAQAHRVAEHPDLEKSTFLL